MSRRIKMDRVSNDKTYYIAVFESRNHAIQIYQYLKKSNLNQYQLVSTPCKIKSGCSYSIKYINEEDMDLLVNESEKLNKKVSGIYLIDRVNNRRTYKKILPI